MSRAITGREALLRYWREGCETTESGVEFQMFTGQDWVEIVATKGPRVVFRIWAEGNSRIRCRVPSGEEFSVARTSVQKMLVTGRPAERKPR